MCSHCHFIHSEHSRYRLCPCHPKNHTHTHTHAHTRAVSHQSMSLSHAQDQPAAAALQGTHRPCYPPGVPSQWQFPDHHLKRHHTQGVQPAHALACSSSCVCVCVCVLKRHHTQGAQPAHGLAQAAHGLACSSSCVCVCVRVRVCVRVCVRTCCSCLPLDLSISADWQRLTAFLNHHLEWLGLQNHIYTQCIYTVLLFLARKYI